MPIARPPEPSPVRVPGAVPAVGAAGATPARPALCPAQRDTLAAVVARVLDGARDLAPGLDAAAVVEQRLARMPAEVQGDLRRVLDLFGSRLAALATVGRAMPFAELAPDAQDRMLARWGASRLPVQRTVFQALRRLSLAAWYGQPPVQAALGYRGPLHDRAPALPWEGPAEGESRDDEPIARVRGATPPLVRSDALATAGGGTTGSAARGRIVPGRAVRGDVRLTADAVVIGTGAGGAVAAARLAEAGLEVVVLEAGGLWTASDFSEREAEMTERLYAQQGMQATEDLALTCFQGETVGGSTTVNWMIMLRPDDHVLDEWARRFGADALAPAAFAPALARIEAEVHARLTPDDAHSPNNLLLLRGARALGWRARAAAINARGCVRSGFCGQGCRYDAKQGTLVTFVPRALAAGATIHADARVSRIAVIERDAGHGRPPRKRVEAAVHDRDSGARCGTLTVEAPLVVLAGGAVGTPALLQRSGMGGGGVGRYLRLHPTTAIPARYGHEIAGGSGIPMTTLCDEFSSSGAHGYGFWIETPPVHPMMAAVAASGFGRAHAEGARDYTRLGTLVCLVRDGADLDRSNGDVRVDRRGRTRLRYRLGPADARHLREGIAAAARLHLAAGAEEVRTLHTTPVIVRREADLAEILTRSVAPNDVTLFSAHVNGTCRLGADPRTSGARSDGDRLGERHGVRGLYVADGSLLPTGVGVNPQATIMALASLVADGIAARWS